MNDQGNRPGEPLEITPSCLEIFLAKISELLQNVSNPATSRRALLLFGANTALNHSVKTILQKEVATKHSLLYITNDFHNRDSPFSGIKPAVRNFVQQHCSAFSADELRNFSQLLLQRVGESITVLHDFLPAEVLSVIRHYGVTPSSIENQLFPGLRALLATLRPPTQALVIHTENVEWIDASSCELIRYLLCIPGGDSVLWTGTAGKGGADLSCLDSLLTELHLENIPVETVWAEDAALKKDAPPTGFKADLVKTRGPAQLVKQIICIASCTPNTGAGLIESITGAEAVIATEALYAGVKEGFLCEREGRFFLTPRAENIISGLAPGEFASLHYQIACYHYQAEKWRYDGSALIELTDHFNKAIEVVRKHCRQAVAASVNYETGLYLLKNEWPEKARHYLSLASELFREVPGARQELYASEMELARIGYGLGEYDAAETHLDRLLETVQDPARREAIFELKIRINNRVGRYRKALLILREGLLEHGLNMPLEEADVLQQNFHLEDHLHMLQRPEKDDFGLSSHPSNRSILRLLFIGGMSLHHSSASLMTWGALQIMIRSGAGMEYTEKAIGYVVYGRVMVMYGNIERGYEYGLKGYEINNFLDDIELRCRVYGVFAFFILPWKKPFGDCMQLLEKAYTAGVEAGDTIGCYVIKTHELNLSLLAGKPLKTVLAVDTGKLNPESELTYYITHYQRNLVRYLIEESNVFTIPVLQPSWLAATNTVLEEKFYRNYVWSRYYFLFGYYDLSARASADADDSRKLQEASPLIPANYLVWFLSFSWNWHNYNYEERKKNKELMDELLSSMQFWASQSPENFASCWWLLKAEDARLCGRTAEILPSFETAVECAGENLWYKALACEATSRYLLCERETMTSGIRYLQKAQHHYLEWGAVAKVKQLQQQFRSLLQQEVNFRDIDIEMIQHELSGDLEVESLAKKLMVLLLRISGSTRVLLKSVEPDGKLRELGSYSLLPFDIRTETPETSIAEAHLMQAYHSQETILIGSPMKGNRSDETGHYAVRSCVVHPVTIRDHLSLVIGLENAFAAGWYTEELIRLIRITANQGAVVIENARIHQVTVKLNEDIRHRMEEQERLALEIKRQENLHLQALQQNQNRERKRIASDLHDRLGSLLSSVKLRFTALSHDVEKSLPQKLTRFTGAVQLLDDAIHELRSIVYNMMPVSLNRFGLKSTIETFIENINSAGTLEIELQILGFDERLSGEMELEVFRICQELIQNVLKHASAKSVRLQIIRHRDDINIIVEDDGKGMDKETMIAGIGFTSIRSRVSLWKGAFSIESQPGKGTMVLVDIPLPPLPPK